MNDLILISGSSGVGKTTIAKLICMALPHDSTVLVSGDDLHLWERNHEKWKEYTHLNPVANDLDRGYTDILQLKNNKTIFRKCYRHDTGKFDEGVEIHPKSIIVYEGLHTLYDERIRNISKIKFFVDTDEDLKTKWKIERDTKKRGYSQQQVLDTISRRHKDEKTFIDPQKLHADVIVKFKKENNNIVLHFQTKSKEHIPLINSIQEVYNNHINFLDICKQIASDINLAQHKGGNISVKIKDTLIITSSGIPFKDISIFTGYSVCDRNKIPLYYRSEEQYEKTVTTCKLLESQERPSMEIGFHNKLGHVVIHTHPIYLNCILCSKQSYKLIQQIFKEFSYKYISYVSPGVDLSNAIHSDCGIFFLENHGLIVSHDDMQMALLISKQINDLSKAWLQKTVPTFFEFNETDIFDECPSLFPDAAVLAINKNINSYMYKTLMAAGLTPNPLSDLEKEKLHNMESEKYRKSLV
jgi:uridine kinase/ribulose-5-phosphate 4-epimerase/fuculose-1-phosphate aldolase